MCTTFNNLWFWVEETKAIRQKRKFEKSSEVFCFRMWCCVTSTELWALPPGMFNFDTKQRDTDMMSSSFMSLVLAKWAGSTLRWEAAGARERESLYARKLDMSLCVMQSLIGDTLLLEWSHQCYISKDYGHGIWTSTATLKLCAMNFSECSI